jgi:hypothetical protein
MLMIEYVDVARVVDAPTTVTDATRLPAASRIEMSTRDLCMTHLTESQ